MASFAIRSVDGTGYDYDQDIYSDVGSSGYSYESVSSTRVKSYDDADNYLLLTGSGFSQSGTGTIKTIDYVIDGIAILRSVGLSLSVSTLAKYQNDPESFAAYIFSGDDAISLTDYADLMRSGSGNDSMDGRKGNDFLAGGAGHDKLIGNAGNDTLFGQSGDDRLIGGGGHDKLNGGSGSDKFIYFNVANGGDAVTDFSSNDILMIEGSAFGLGAYQGTLKSNNFITRNNSNLAIDFSDRFIFNKADHTLWYDSDGKGSKEAVLMLDLTNTFVITHADVLII